MISRFIMRNRLFTEWCARWAEINAWLNDERGRPAEAARQLGVSRQTLHRWMHAHPLPPAWAFWALSSWHRQARRGTQMPMPLVRLGSDVDPPDPTHRPPPCPPGE